MTASALFTASVMARVSVSCPSMTVSVSRAASLAGLRAKAVTV
jgi:hypothetical protein